MRHALLLSLVLLLVDGMALAARPVVAVFAVELRGVPGRAGLSDALTSYLGTRLGETGQFEVVPQARIRRALAARRRDSHRPCYATSCQIEIGQEVAASLALDTRVYRMASSCVMMSNLYDLRRSTTGAAATAIGACGEPALLRLIDRVVGKLASGATSRRDPGPPTATIERRRSDPSELLVLGGPDGARVLVTSMPGRKQRECRIPCRLSPLPPAAYILEVSAPGYLSDRRMITVSLNRVLALSVDLKPGASTDGSTEPPASQPEPGETTAAKPPPTLMSGLTVAALTPRVRARHAVPEQVNLGVMVERVAPGSAAARLDIQAGDIIVEVNGIKIETVGGLRRLLSRPPGRVRILIHRSGRSFIVTCHRC